MQPVLLCSVQKQLSCTKMNDRTKTHRRGVGGSEHVFFGPSKGVPHHEKNVRVLKDTRSYWHCSQCAFTLTKVENVFHVILFCQLLVSTQILLICLF